MGVKVKISSELLEKHSGIKIAYLVARNIQITSTPPREKKLARAAEAAIRSSLSLEGLVLDPTLASWLRLWRAMGLSSLDERPAQIQLIERILSNREIPKINNVVDAANIEAARCRCPVGVFDLDRIEGVISLRLARDGEVMRPLLGKRDITLPPGEIVYADDAGVFSRYSKDADRTKITDTTRRVFAVVDGTADVTIGHVVDARNDLAFLFRELSGTPPEIETGLVGSDSHD